MVRRRRSTPTRNCKFAEEEAAKAREKLTEAQNALATFKSDNHIADLQQQVSQLLLQRTDVETRLNIAQAHVAEAEQREAALKQLLQGRARDT